MPEDRGSLLQPHRDAPLSTSSTDARLTGAGVVCVFKTASNLLGAEQTAKKQQWCCGLVPRELARRKRQEGKTGCFFYQLHQLGLEEVCSLRAAPAAVCPQAQPDAPPQSRCSQAPVQQSSCWRRGRQMLPGPCKCGRGKGHQNPSCSPSTV